jgi:DNA-binding PadR family transcriptional regulator
VLRFALLTLLAERPHHGYELKQRLDELFAGTWPVFIAQIYSTLARLERDGLVSCKVVPQAGLPDRKVYAVTERGEEDLARWLDEPAPGTVAVKDEVYLKVIGHLRRGSDPRVLLTQQRQADMQALAELNALRAADGHTQPTALLIEGAILHLKADLEWLDRCEELIKGGRR